uniref:Putative ribosomal RNA methyltransferase NOP2 (inferred by orthology to a human protein) n=1 Tax=Strongyloides venezuelensis TaxID=75913 RepID=A0A0K0F8Z2_STRVS
MVSTRSRKRNHTDASPLVSVDYSKNPEKVARKKIVDSGETPIRRKTPIKKLKKSSGGTLVKSNLSTPHKLETPQANVTPKLISNGTSKITNVSLSAQVERPKLTFKGKKSPKQKIVQSVDRSTTLKSNQTFNESKKVLSNEVSEETKSSTSSGVNNKIKISPKTKDFSVGGLSTIPNDSKNSTPKRTVKASKDVVNTFTPKKETPKESSMKKKDGTPKTTPKYSGKSTLQRISGINQKPVVENISEKLSDTVVFDKKLNDGKSTSTTKKVKKIKKKVTLRKVKESVKNNTKIDEDKINVDNTSTEESSKTRNMSQKMRKLRKRKAKLERKISAKKSRTEQSSGILNGDNSDDDDDEKLPIELANEELEAEQKDEFKMTRKEALSNVEGFVLPSNEEIEKECYPGQLPNLLRERLAGICSVLGGKFNETCTDGRPRHDYTDAFEKYVACLYGYNSCLTSRFFSIYSNPDECINFMEANDNHRPCSIRTNTLKTKKSTLKQQLSNRGVNCIGAEDWNKTAMVISDSNVPVGATLEYLSGQYFIQGIASMLPVSALAPQPNEKVLDMCSAPGGKTTHMASLMKNTGVLIANDISKDRLPSVIGNVHRCGVTNVAVTNLNACLFPKMFKQYFDRILLDAPCSGTGVIWKDERVKHLRTTENINHLRSIQRNLLLAAIDSCNASSKTGGYIVYSTCSVLIEENESVVDFALKKRNVKLVPTGIEAGDDGFTKHRQHRFDPSLILCKRFTPHKNNVDGFFIAKFKKISNDKDGTDLGIVEYINEEKPSQE